MENESLNTTPSISGLAKRSVSNTGSCSKNSTPQNNNYSIKGKNSWYGAIDFDFETKFLFGMTYCDKGDLLWLEIAGHGHFQWLAFKID